MKKYPSHQFSAFIPDIAREVVIHEFTEGFIKQAQENPELDNRRTALKACTDMTDDEIDQLGMRVAQEIYEDIVDLTHPGLREEREKQIAEGTYKEPTEAELEDAKKN
jgi:hypothetical protein